MSGIIGAMMGGWAPLSVTTLPADYVTGYSSSTPVTTGPVSAIVSGGSGTVTYLWVQTGGDTMTIALPTSASTYFSASGMTHGQQKEGTFMVTVTDTITGVTASAEIYASVERA